MKILMITHGFPPDESGGTESYVLRLARELTRREHRVEVFCGSHSGAGQGEALPRLVHTVHQGIPVHRLHRTGLFVDHWEKSLAPEVEPSLAETLERFRPDLVHIHHWIRLTRNLVEICQERGFPTLATLHDLWTTCPRAFRVREDSFCTRPVGPESCLGCAPTGETLGTEDAQRELALFRDDFANELGLARRLIVPSNAHRDVLVSHHPGLAGRFRVVPHGNISPIRRRRPRTTPADQDVLRIGHWGHLSRLKGIDILLEAVAGSSSRWKMGLEIFGKVVYPSERQRIDRLATGLDVTWHGAYMPTDLLKVPLDLAVIPTRCSESWSFVLDEAFLLGLPAIVADRGALPERLNGAGATFRAEDPADLRRVLEGVLARPDTLERWKSRIPALPTMASHLKALERVYHEVVSSHAPLPETSRDLRQHRLAARTFQLENAKRLIEEERARARNAAEDFRLAGEALREMDHFHQEKDKEILRLQELASKSDDAPRQAQLSKRIADLEQRLDQERARTASTIEDLQRARQTLEEMDHFHREKDKELARLQALASGHAEVLQERDQLTKRNADLEEANRRRMVRGRKRQARLTARIRALEERLRKLDRYEEWLGDATRSEIGQEDERASLRAPFGASPMSLEERRHQLATLLEKNRTLDSELRDLHEHLTVSLTLAEGGPDTEEPVRDATDAPPAFEDAGALMRPGSSRVPSARLLDLAILGQERLQDLLARRDALIRSMAGSLETLLETVEGLERRRKASRATARPPAAGRRLKILMLVHQFLPRHVAGTEVYTRNLALELSQRHDVVIATAESHHDRPRYEQSERTVDGLRVRQVIHNYKWEHFRETYDCPEMDAIFRRILREESPDILHIQHLHYWSANIITIAHAKGIPVVYTLHDYGLICPRDGQMRKAGGELCDAAVPASCADCIGAMPWPVDERPPPPIPRGLTPSAEALVDADVTRALRRLRNQEQVTQSVEAEAAAERLEYLARVLRDVDLFISPSAFLAGKLRDSHLVPSGRLLVSDNGLDLTTFGGGYLPARLPQDRLRVGYVGTLAEHKGVHVLIEAMNGIEDARVSCRVWGDVNAFVEYTERLRRLSTNPRTLLMGSFHPSRVAEIMASLDLLVVPSLWWENSPLTIHEAALAGIPVVASDLGGMAEYVKPGVTGLLTRAGDVADLRTRISGFLAGTALERFDPSAFPIKTIADDARTMEERYIRLLEHTSVLA